nr:pseudouridine synthase [Xenophilus sp. Marseille-Q4582]
MPTLDGLSPSCVALPPGPWAQVLDFLCERFPQVPRADWVARMQAGRVVDAQGRPVPPERPYAKDLRVWYYRELPDEPPVPGEARIVFQDEWLVVADKPHFLPVIPSGRHVRETLLVRLKKQLGLDTLAPIHRIDRETAGLVVFAIQPATRGAYQRLFEQRLVAKRYEALVHWPPPRPLPAVYRSRLESVFMRSQEVAGEPNSETAIDILAEHGPVAHLALRPHTGRKHQLRAHCCALGVPILHDGIYPALRPEGADDFARPLQLLAQAIAFTDPVTGAPRRFESARTLDAAVARTAATGR